MAAGTESYEAPQYGNLAGAIGEKIGSALTMAAGARRRRDQEIEELNNKKDKTDEEKQRLKDLQSQKFGFIARKALGTEFGGDMRRRTTGFFQMNPADENDPALDKKKRFEALLRAQPTGRMPAPAPAPEAPRTVQDGGVLGSFATGIIEKISLLSKKVDDLKSVEQKDQTPAAVVNLSKNQSIIRRFFSKNNKTEEEKVAVARQALEQQRQAAADAKQAQAEANAEGRNRTAGSIGIDNLREGGSGGGLLGGLLDFGMDLLGLGGGRRGGGRRGGGKNRMPRMSKGRMYTNPIGPQPMGSRSPWARARGGRGIAGFAPRMVSRVLPRKLASGGIVDNPTSISGPSDQAVIPQNKLTEAVKSNQENVKKADPFAKVMQLPTMAAGALLLSTVGNVINNMGGVSKLFRPVLQRMFVPAATVFGLPANLITAFFGGGAASLAGGLGGKNTRTRKGKSGGGGGGSSSSSGGGASPGSTIMGGTVTGGGSVDGYGVTSGFGMRDIMGRGPKMHWGVDYGTPQGTKLSLKKPGKVIETTVPAIGNNGAIYIQHDDGSKSRYLHMSAVAVSPGERVEAGGFLGKTGGQPGTPGAGPTTGPHLHFEYYPPGASGPADGSGVASSIFSVGGQLTPNAPPAAPQPTTSPSTSAQTPQPASATPRSNQPTTLPPIVLPRPAQTTPPAKPDNTGNGGANLPVRNPNAQTSLTGGNP